jgi:predicted DNA binding protein
MQYSKIQRNELKQFVDIYFRDRNHDTISIRVNNRNRDIYDGDYILKDKKGNLFVVSSDVFARDYAAFLEKE